MEPCWFEKRITACWLFFWAFIFAIFAPEKTIASVYVELDEIIRDGSKLL